MTEQQLADKEVPCLFSDCDEKFLLKNGDEDEDCNDTSLLEKHLMESHNLVIDSISTIADLPSYLSFWRKLISADTANVHCFVFRNEVGENNGASNVKATSVVNKDCYLFLTPDNPDDARLRNQLHEKRLARVTELYQAERLSTKSYPCIFCNDVWLSRSNIFEHLSDEHSFWLGEPDNMVFVGELLHRLGQMVDKNICLYCEKEFRSRFVLKEHMRKRNHRRVKPANGLKYAKYFISAYLKPGGFQKVRVRIGADPFAGGTAAPSSASSAAATSSEDEDSEEDDSREEVDDKVVNAVVIRNSQPDRDVELQTAAVSADYNSAATEDAIDQLACPLCKKIMPHCQVLNHLTVDHSVNLSDLTRRYNLDFYQRLQLLALVRLRPRQSSESLVKALLADRDCNISGCVPTEAEVAVADLCDDSV